jgi:hypothetical protein
MIALLVAFLVRFLAAPVPFRRPYLASGLDQQRADQQRVEEMAGRVFEVSGYQDFRKSGEMLFTVTFPVLFLEEPVPGGFVGVLTTNQALETGNFPQITGAVKSWTTKVGDDGTTLYYEGATMIGLCLGHETMKGRLWWTVKGRALRNPLNDNGSAESPV